MLHHKSWFPAVVVVLTLALAVLIFALFRGRVTTQSTESTTAATTISPVTEAQYQSNVHQIVSGLPDKLTAAPNNDARVSILSTDRDALLNLTVPSDDRDLHLTMVTTINAWIAGEQGDAIKLAAAAQQWNQLVAQNSWMR